MNENQLVVIEYKEGMTIEPGMVISGMPNSVYHKTSWKSSTGVKRALVSYENYEYWKGKSESKYVYDFGNVFHSGIESQIEFGDYSKWDERVKDCPNKTTSAKFLALKEKDQKSYFIHADDKELVEKLVDKTIETTSEVNLLENGYCELSMFWIDETTGLKCKCRPDFFRPDIGLCVDYKTCQDSGIVQFSKDIANFGYHVSAAFYADGIKAATGIDLYDENNGGFIFVATQKTEPWFVNMFQLDYLSIEEGKLKYSEGLTTIKEESKEIDVTEISIPRWAFTRD